MKFPPATMLLTLFPTTMAAATAAAEPPAAAVKPHEVESPNGARVDPYYWLRDDTRSKAEVLGYLTAERAYYDAMSAPYRALTEKLSREIIGRLKQDDSTVPYKYKDYLYYTRYETGKE